MSNKMKKDKLRQDNLWTKKERKVLISTGSVVFFFALVFISHLLWDDYNKTNAYKAYVGIEIPDSMVCMVNGEIKNKAITSVEVMGKTYYGCCGNCISKLKGNLNNSLYSMDPVTGKRIDKADAYIRINPKNKKQAAFFESIDTYNSYIKTIQTNTL